MANGIRIGNPVDSIKDVVRSSVKVPELGKHLEKAGWHIDRNVVVITIKMKTIVRKPLMIKIIKLRLRNLNNKHLKKAVGHIGRNVVEIIIKMKTIVRKPLMIKIIKLRLRNLDNKHLKKAGGNIDRNVVKITIKIKTIVRKPLMIKTPICRAFTTTSSFSITFVCCELRAQ